MMKIFGLGVIIFILPFLASANVWDNLFGGEGVPFELPINFTAEIVPANISERVKYDMLSSVVYNALALNMTSETKSAQGVKNSVVTQFKFNFNLGFLWTYSEPKGCVRIYDPDLIFNFYYRVEGLLELALLLTSRDLVGGYKRIEFDPKILSLEIANCVNDVSLYFLDDKTLSRIDSDFKNGTKASFIINSIGQKHNVNYKDFSPHADWNCKELHQVEIQNEKYLVDSEGKKQTFSEVLSDIVHGSSEDFSNDEDRQAHITSFEKFRQSFIHC